jgi:molybdopterin/thiamine biosynthesis adenylyltransferase
MEKLIIIGLGGIGSILSDKISRFSNFDKARKTTITLVDGDYYEEKNFERQDFYSLGNKAAVKANELRSRYENIDFESIPYFVDENLISKLIGEGNTVFLAVDNHKTRKLVSDYAKNLKDITIISGGNDLTDGNVQIYVRKGGENLTPSLTDYHPEIENPEDKLPNEMSCEELQNSEPQLFFTNLGVATIMCWSFYNIKNMDLTNSEIYFDIKSMRAHSTSREPKN